MVGHLLGLDTTRNGLSWPDYRRRDAATYSSLTCVNSGSSVSIRRAYKTCFWSKRVWKHGTCFWQYQSLWCTVSPRSYRGCFWWPICSWQESVTVGCPNHFKCPCNECIWSSQFKSRIWLFVVRASQHSSIWSDEYSCVWTWKSTLALGHGRLHCTKRCFWPGWWPEQTFFGLWCTC